MRELLRGLARDLGVDLGGSPKSVRDYSDAVPGSRAEGRGAGEKGWRERWIAGDFRAGEFRRRRDALRHCEDGVQPFLVLISPGSWPKTFRAGVARSTAREVRDAHERAHEFDLIVPGTVTHGAAA